MKRLIVLVALVGALASASEAHAFGFRLGPEFLFHPAETKTLFAFGLDGDIHLIGPLNFHTGGLLGVNGSCLTWDATFGLKLKFRVGGLLLLGIRGDFVLRGYVPFEGNDSSGLALGGAVTPEIGFALGRFELFVDVEFQIFEYVYPDDVLAQGSEDVQFALYVTPGFRF